MLILSWSCRGLKNASTVTTLRSFLRATRAHIGFITETKCDLQYSEQLITRLGFQKFVIIPAIGLSGGILFFWDDSIDVTILSATKNLIHVSIGGTQAVPTWELLCFYGPPAQSDRNKFWIEMIPLTSSITVPFVCIGDFNSITHQSEKRGGSDFVTSTVHGFNSWVADSGLLDLGYIGPAFTWENRQQMGHNVTERLDRAFGSGPWCLNFPKAGVMHLPRYNSDHNPILLKSRMNDTYKPPPPRFEAFWLQKESFKETLTDFWQHRVTASSLPIRLKHLLADLKRWGANTFGSISKQIKRTEDRLLHLQNCTPSDEIMNEEKELRLKINDLQKLEETFWQQRSRVKRLSDGDKNTRFFHLAALNRRRRNNIASLILPDGRWTHDFDVITKTLIHHFRTASKALPTTTIPTYIITSLPKISERDNDLLSEIPTIEEISAVIHEIGAGKAPGPDGLPALFFHHCWDVVGEEVINLVQNFFIHKVMPDALNHTFLCLLPKKREAFNPTDFRPIYLCNVLYKLITKIITIRLRPLLNNLISTVQNAFIPGGQISDNLVLAQELIHSMNNSKKFNCSFALKLDMAKAYDRVSWPFLSNVLMGFGLSGATHDIIMACVTSPTFSVLVNGSPQGYFAAERGLRQGCPLSPYLFILCSEILSQVTKDAESNQRYKGLQINQRAPAISHLLFADDLFFFGPATIENALGVKSILQQYESYSGQMVNFEKSCIYTSPRLDPTMQQLLMDILGVCIMAKTDKYLGKQLLLPSARISSYSDLISRCTQKLAAWKSSSLSHAGKLTFLKSSLASIPIYSMGTTLLPKGVASKLSQLQRQFWWGSTPEKKKLCLISWDKITKPKGQGGLGVRDPELVNISLIAKLVWRFLTQVDSLWSILLKAKYLRNGSFWDAKKPYICSPIWRSMLHCRDLIKPGVCWEIGDGTKVNIWDEPWVITLPGFRAVGKEKSQEMATRVCELFITGSKQWNLPLLQDLFEPLTAAAIARIHVPPTGTVDKLLWLPHSKGLFTPKSMYKQLTVDQPTCSSTTVSSHSFNWTKLWQINGIAPRAILFLWRAIHGGLAVGAKLNRIMGANGLCSGCNNLMETVQHMLIHCSIAYGVWKQSTLLNNCYHQDLTIVELFSHLLQQDQDSLRQGCAIIWAIWKARNSRVFKGARIDTMVTFRQTMDLYQDYKNPRRAIPNVLHNMATHPQSLSWNLPPTGFIKINIDGAHKYGLNAAGAIARDSQGSFIGCITEASFPGTPIEAEAKGFSLDLDLINSLNLHHVIVESDALAIINSLHNQGTATDWRINSTIHRCLDLLNNRTDITFTYIPREANNSAHDLAAFAFNHDISRSWNGGLPPPFILDHLFADLATIVTPSVINE